MDFAILNYTSSHNRKFDARSSPDTVSTHDSCIIAFHADFDILKTPRTQIEIDRIK